MFLGGCNPNARNNYEDYNEDDFVVVQGVITKSIPHRIYSGRVIYAGNDINFLYDLNGTSPKNGFETKSSFILNQGEPVLVLVHKSYDSIAFISTRGIIDKELLVNFLNKCEINNWDDFGLRDWLDSNPNSTVLKPIK